MQLTKGPKAKIADLTPATLRQVRVHFEVKNSECYCAILK
jgi:hypothetical protein